MNVQKSLYRTLLRLGINMNDPPKYVVSRSDPFGDLILACLEKKGSSLYILLATYWIEDDKAFPEPEVVVQIMPAEQRATSITCEWRDSKEIASTSLDRRIRDWLETQVQNGHSFLPVRGIPHAVAVVCKDHQSGSERA
jgi:hypothetical protein